MKLVSTNRNDISTYIAKIRIGWIKPVIAAAVNLTLDVAQKTRVLNPYIMTQPNSAEFMNMSMFIILEIMHPKMMKTPRINMEMHDKNIECFIFMLIP